MKRSRVMKIKKLEFYILISILCFSCAICPPSTEYPKQISFSFSITDKEGKDLFFGENSSYDPHNVKFAVGQEEEVPEYWFSVNESQKCFALNSFYPMEKPYIFYLKFVPDRIDTIKIESRFGKSERCHLPPFNIDVFFNNIQICKDCSDKIYKIEIK